MKKKCLIFSTWQTFSISLLFSGKKEFLKISADFVTEFQKLLFRLKENEVDLQTIKLLLK